MAETRFDPDEPVIVVDSFIKFSQLRNIIIGHLQSLQGFKFHENFIQ